MEINTNEQSNTSTGRRKTSENSSVSPLPEKRLATPATRNSPEQSASSLSGPATPPAAVQHTSSPQSAPPALGSNKEATPGGVLSPDLVAARVKLLSALGLTPDYLVQSGLLDRPTLLSLLGAGFGKYIWLRDGKH